MNISKLFDYSAPLVAAATILVIGAFAISLYGGKVVTDIRLANDSVEVTGSARIPVVADTGRWIINLETKTGVSDQQAGFDRLEAAVSKISAYLIQEGLTEYESSIGSSYPNYVYPEESEPIQTGYNVSRVVMVRSTDISKLSALANTITPLTGVGYSVSTGALELTYSKLAETRVELLTEAIKDAHNRAKAIAQDSGRSVGTLRNASGGVVQVLPEGSVDISDYGSYDTVSMKKEVMVTVRATFSLE